jgi:ABC-type arginine transport system ATPase subunit
MRAEFEEVIAGARQTIAQSQALLVEADAILAKEKTCRITPQLTSQCHDHYSRDRC